MTCFACWRNSTLVLPRPAVYRPQLSYNKPLLPRHDILPPVLSDEQSLSRPSQSLQSLQSLSQYHPYLEADSCKRLAVKEALHLLTARVALDHYAAPRVRPWLMVTLGKRPSERRPTNPQAGVTRCP